MQANTLSFNIDTERIGDIIPYTNIDNSNL